MSQANSIKELELIRFPLRGLRLIEASAGTGKTYSIAALYVRLILGHGREDQLPLMPPQILVLTFTRAATQELRERIRARLTETARVFRNGQPGGDTFLVDLLAAYPEPEARAACARRLQVAAEWMDEAAIHTIHAWCQTMLRQHAFDSGSLFDQEVDSADQSLLQQVINDYWRRFMYVDHELADHLGELAETPAQLARSVQRLLKPGLAFRIDGQAAIGKAPAEALEDLLAWKHEQAACLDELQKTWQAQADSARSFLRDAVENKYLKVPYSKWENCKAWFDTINAWNTSAELAETLVNLRPDRINDCISKKGEGNWSAEHTLFHAIAKTLDALPAKPRWTAAVWPHAVEWITNRYQREKRERNQLDFDDLLHQLDRALVGRGGARLRTRILDSFPVALIDEFQDTDPVQYRIFERVFAAERNNAAHGLFMIGDPKQAIYAFRGADIFTYLDARRQTAVEDRYTLATNYRSTEAMVKAVNHWFSVGERRADGAFGFRRDQVNPVPFHSVKASGRDKRLVVDRDSPSGESTPQPALNLWFQPPDGGYVSNSAYRDRMAAIAATEITRLLNQGRSNPPQAGFEHPDGRVVAVKPSDIAVLVTNRFEADAVQNELRHRGVDCVYLSERNSIFDQPEAVDLVAILEAAAAPNDAWLVRNALAVPSLCARISELDALRHDEQRLEAEMQLFAGLSKTWREHGVLAMLRRLFTAKSAPERLFERSAGGERTLTNLLHLAELLQTESQQQDGEQALINYLRREVVNTERSDNEAHVLRLESDADLVKVITIFKSKGLQYPLVFVPFACSYKPLSENEPFLEFHEDGPDGRSQRVLELAGHSKALARARVEKRQEQLRLLYVALTRSEHACWVGLAPVLSLPDGQRPGKADCADLSAFAPGHLLLGLLDEAEVDQMAAGESFDMKNLLDRLVSSRDELSLTIADESLIDGTRLTAEVKEAELSAARQYQGEPREHWWVASYSALRHGWPATSALEEAESAVAANLAEMARDDSPDDELPDPSAVEPQARSIHAFPRGAMPGNFLHLLLEWAGKEGFRRVLGQSERMHAEIEQRLERRGWGHLTGTVVGWLESQLAAPIRLGESRLRLIDLQPEKHQYKPELEFWLAADGADALAIDRLVTAHTLDGQPRAPFEPNHLNGMLHGFIDLVFQHQGRWYVADYKSNWVGPSADYYSRERMAAVVRSRRYDMQFVFYTLALHRLLKSRLGKDYDPEQHLGGAAYLFLRGCDNADTGGVFFEPANLALMDALDRLFAGREVRDVA